MKTRRSGSSSGWASNQVLRRAACGNPAILVYAALMAPTERTDIGYAMICPSATIIKVIAVQVVGLALLGY
jgi:hypothetical protein